MPDFHYVALRTFCHATEDEAKVRAAMRTLVGDIGLTETVAEGSHGNPILILEANLSRSADIRAFWARVAESGALARLRDEAGQRIDDEGTFYARLSKEAALDGRIAVADEEDPVQLRAKPAAFPSTREGALEVLLRAFDRAETRRGR